MADYTDDITNKYDKETGVNESTLKRADTETRFAALKSNLKKSKLANKLDVVVNRRSGYKNIVDPKTGVLATKYKDEIATYIASYVYPVYVERKKRGGGVPSVNANYVRGVEEVLSSAVGAEKGQPWFAGLWNPGR